MKNLRKSTKLIIISICVAVIAVTGILAGVILGNRKGKGGTPAPDEGGSNIAYSYALTEEQKKLVADVNEQRKETILSEKGKSLEVLKSKFTDANIVMGDVVYFDGERCVTCYNDVYNAYVLENDSFISVQAYMAQNEMINSNLSKFNIVGYYNGFLLASQEYSVGTDVFVDYYVISFAGDVEITKTFHLISESDVLLLGETTSFILTPFKNFFTVYYASETGFDICFYEYLDDYTDYDYGYIIRDKFIQVDEENFEFEKIKSFYYEGNTGLGVLYKNDELEVVRYSDELGFYRFNLEEEELGYSYRSHGLNIIENVVKGEVDEYSVYVEEENDGYYANYSYQIKFGDEEFVDLTLDKKYAKITPVFASDKYFGLCCQNVDADNILKEESTYYYFDYEMNLVVKYYSETSDAEIMFSDGFKLFTADGIYASEALIETNKILNFEELNLSVASVDYSLDYYVVKNTTDSYIVSVDDLLFHLDKGVNNVYSIGDGLYLSEKEGQYSLFDTKINEITPINLNVLTTLNFELIENYGIYFVNNGTGYNICVGRNVYENTVVEAYGLNYLRFKQNSKDYYLYLNGEELYSFKLESDNYSATLDEQNAEVDNYTNIAGDLISYSSSNPSSKTYNIDITFKDGVYPSATDALYIYFDRNTSADEYLLRMPIWISVESGEAKIKCGAVELFNKQHKTVVESDANLTDFDYADYTTEVVGHIKWWNIKKWRWEYTPIYLPAIWLYYQRSVQLENGYPTINVSDVGISVTFRFKDTNTKDNTLNGLSLGFFNGKETQYKNKNSSVAKELYYNLTSFYVNSPNVDFSTLLTQKIEDNDTYDVKTTNTIKYGTKNHYITGELSSEITSIKGATWCGITSMGSGSIETKSVGDIYNSDNESMCNKIGSSISITSILIKETSSKFSYYFTLSSNNKYIYSQGNLNKTRYVYSIYEPNTITVKLNLGDGIVESEVPTYEVKKVNSNGSKEYSSPASETLSTSDKEIEFTITYARFFKLSAETTHYNLTNWKVENSSIDNTYSVGEIFTKIDTDDNEVNITAVWDAKTYDVKAYVYSYDSTKKSYLGYVYDEEKQKINIANQQVIMQDIEPKYYASNDPQGSKNLNASDNGILQDGSSNELKLTTFKYDKFESETVNLELQDLFSGEHGNNYKIDTKYQTIIPACDYEFYAWAYCMPYNNGANKNIGESDFASSCSIEVFDNLLCGGTTIYLMAVYKEKIYTISVDSQPIGGSLQETNNKEDLAFVGGTGSDEDTSTVNNFYNYASTDPEYSLVLNKILSTGSTNTQLIRNFRSKTGEKGSLVDPDRDDTNNTEKDIRVKNNIEMIISVKSAYYLYKFELTNLVFKYKDSTSFKYYTVTVTLTYSRGTDEDGWKVETNSNKFKYNETTGYFSSYEENVLKINKVDDTKYKISISKLANPSENPVDGKETISGEAGFTIKIYANSLTATDNDIVIHDSTITSDSLFNANTNNNIAYEYGTQILKLDPSKGSAYFWYAGRKQYLYHKFTGTVTLKEGFFKTSSNESDDYNYSGTDIGRSNFLTKGSTSTDVNIYLQKSGDNWIVFYPQIQYKGNKSDSQGSSVKLDVDSLISSPNKDSGLISFNNTRLIAFEPYQSKINLSTNPSTYNASNYYELRSYISSIDIGFQTLFTFSTPTRTLLEDVNLSEYSEDIFGSGNKAYVQDYFYLNASGLAERIIDDNDLQGKIFKYLGDNYIIHDAYKASYSNAVYYLYLARRSTDNYTVYFLLYDDHRVDGVTSLSASYSSEIVINVNSFNYSINFETTSGVSNVDSYASGKEKKFAIYRDKANVLFNSVNYDFRDATKQNLTYSNNTCTITANPSDNNVFAIVPNDGYFIKSFTLSVDGTVIYSFMLNDTSFNSIRRSDNGDYLYTYTDVETGTTPLITYDVVQGNVIHSDLYKLTGVTNYDNNRSTRFGVYYDNFGTTNWNTFNLSSSTYQFNYLFFMIGGLYDDVDIDFELVSYAEFVFEFDSQSAATFFDNLSSADLTSVVNEGMYSDYTELFEKLKINFYSFNSSRTTSALQTKSALLGGEGKVLVKYSIMPGNGVLQNTLRIIFLGKADLIKYGLFVSASDTNYSYYFTDGRYYISSSGNVEHEGKTFTDPFTYLGDYSGRNADRKPFESKSDLDYTDILVYMGLGTESNSSLRKFFNNYGFDKYATEILTIKDMERSCKYLLAVRVSKNEVNATVNSYVYNDNLVSGNIAFNNVYAWSSINDYKYNISYKGDNKIFFLDTTSTNADRSEAYQLDNSATKQQSWFNDIVLTNININNAGTDKNWQSIVPGLASEANANRFKVYGYGITFDYYEVPGYYLNYVCVNIKEHGLVIINIPQLVPKEGIIEINKSLTIGGSAHDKVHYTFHIKYDPSTDDISGAKFTFKIYQNTLDKDDFFSTGILANDIEISFLSNSYNFAVHYNYFDFGDSDTFTSFDQKEMQGVSNTGTAASPVYVQNIRYDTLSKINPVASMPGYTFIGWGSKMYYGFNHNFDTYMYMPRQVHYSETGLNTWNSTSSWFNVAKNNYFDFNKRQAFIGKTESLLADYSAINAVYPGTAFYVSGSNFVTDTGNTETENYNFWINYISNFTSTIGRYLTYTQTDTSYKVVDNTYVDKRNIDLYGVWKANTYAISFNLNSLEEHDSTVYLDFDSNNEFLYELHESKFAFNIKMTDNYYYAFVAFDTNLWYVTTDKNFSYSANYNMLAENNMLKLIVDRYGYTWLGWYNVKQSSELRESSYEISTLSASFASKYYNQIKGIDKSLEKIPKFDKTFYDANNINDSEFATNPFEYYDKNYNSTNSDIKIYHYCYSNYSGETLLKIGGEGNSISNVGYNLTYDYLNDVGFFDGGYLFKTFGKQFSIVTYYDTVLANDCYVASAVIPDNGVSYALLDITKLGAMRMITLYAYWQTNKYKVIYDWQDKEQIDDTSGDTIYSSLNHLGSTVTVDYSIQDAQDPDGTRNYYYFNDTDLDAALRSLTPKRVGYDFIGWTFNYIPDSSTEFDVEVDGINIKNSVNTPSSIYYLTSEMMTKYNNLNSVLNSTIPNSASVLFTNGNLIKNFDANDIEATNWILNYDSYEDDGIKYNNYSEQLGGDDLYEGHFVYIFALWKPQTFSINVSLNIQQEELENLYEIDSDFAVSLYNGAVENRYTNSIGVNTGYYLYDSMNFNDIVANIAFEIEFDQKFETASIKFAGKNYNISDFFATSAGYYFMGLMINNEYDSDVNNYLLVNTLNSVLGESGLINKDSDGDVYYHNIFGTEDNFEPIFDYDYYNLLYYSHHKIYDDGNELNNRFSAGNYDFLQNIDDPGYSTNFGYLDTQDLPGYDDLYISSEYEPGVGASSGNYYLYVTIKGRKYYVVYYEYNSDSAGGYKKDTITFDKTFLYYNINGKQYKLHFALNESKIEDASVPTFLKYNAYYVTENFTNKRVDLTLRIALYTEKTNVLQEKTDGDKAVVDNGLISYTSSGGANSEYRVGEISLNGAVIPFNLRTMTTRQFTLYTHWKNKIIDINLINASAGTISEQIENKNYGLSGYYYVEDLTFDRENTKYDANNIDHDDLMFNENNNSYFESTTEITNKDTISMNYYDTAEFLVMPYFNGRYLSEMSFTFDDVLETKNEDGSSKFVLLKRTITFKFAFNSSTKNLLIKSVSSTFETPKLHSYVENGIQNNYIEHDDYFDQLFSTKSLLSIIDQNALAYILQGTSTIKDTNTEGKYYYSLENEYSGGGFRISKYLEKYYDALNPNCNESGYVDVFEKGRTNINPIRFKLNDIMSSIDISCKFSLQTFELKLYSVKNDAGHELKKTDYSIEVNGQVQVFDDYYYASSYGGLDKFEEDSNKNTNNVMTLGPAYVSSSGYNKDNIATVKTDCSDISSQSYNIPYGYYLYGMSFNSNIAPNRPIDNTNLYPFFNADPDRPQHEVELDKNRYFGFNYIYSLGNYYVGETDVLMVPKTSSTYSSSEYYSRQCSAALGSISLGESEGIRLTNLASYAFSGWYEVTGATKAVDGVNCLLLNQYSYIDEGSYICRNIELYGYYYNADKSTSVSFYYWDNDARKYVVYGENKDIYTLENEIEGSGYKVNDAEDNRSIIVDSNHSDIERFTTYNNTYVSTFMISTSFGANLGDEGFEGGKYSTKEFNIENDDERAFINSIVDTYWYYKTMVRIIYFEDAQGYRYFAREVDQSEAGGEVVVGTKFAFVKEGTDNELYNFAPDDSYDPQYYVRIKYQEFNNILAYYVDGDWVENLKYNNRLYNLDRTPILSGVLYNESNEYYVYNKIEEFNEGDWVDNKWQANYTIYNSSKHLVETGTEFNPDETYYIFEEYTYVEDDWVVSFKYGAINSRIKLRTLDGPKQGTYSDNIADNLIEYNYNENDWMNLRLKEGTELFYKVGGDYIKVTEYTSFDSYPSYYVKATYELNDNDWVWTVKNIELYDSNKQPVASGSVFDPNQSYYIREDYKFEEHESDWQSSYNSSDLLFDENKQSIPIGTIYNSENDYFVLIEYKYEENLDDWEKLLRSDLDLYYKNDDGSITKVTKFIEGKETYKLVEYDIMGNESDWPDTFFAGGKLLCDSELNLVNVGDQYNGDAYYELEVFETTASDWNTVLKTDVELYDENGQLLTGEVKYNSAKKYCIFDDYQYDPDDWVSVLKLGPEVYDEEGNRLPVNTVYDSKNSYYKFNLYEKSDDDLIRKLKPNILIYSESATSGTYELLASGAVYNKEKDYYLFSSYVNDASDWYNTLNNNIILFYQNGEIVPFNHVYDEHEDYYIYSSFVYDFTGAELYALYNNRYYKINKVSSFDKFYGKARFTVEIDKKVYYLVNSENDGAGSTRWYVESDGKLVQDSTAANRKITILKNYFVIYDNKYYPIKYPEFRDSAGTGSVYYNPSVYYAQNTKEEFKQYMVTVEIEGRTLFLDYVNGRLYLEEQMISLAPIDTYRLYTPLNDNFTVNLTRSSTTGDSVSYITVASVNLTKLPNINSTEQYNNEEYGFVTYIRLDKTIIADGFAKLNSSEEKGIYPTFKNYIESNYYVINPEDSEEVKEQKREMLAEMLKVLNNNLTLYVNANEIFNEFILPISYTYDDSKNYIEKVTVSIPVKFRFNSYKYESGQVVSVDSFYLTLLCEYEFDVINDRTEIESELYAIPIFAPHVIKFDDDSFDYSGKGENAELPDAGEEEPENGGEAVETLAEGAVQADNTTNVQIYVDKMQAYFYEVTSEYSKLYTEENGNYLNFTVLTAEQYAFLIDDMYRDKASNLTILLNQGLRVYNNSQIDGGVGDPTKPDIAEIGIPIIEDTTKLNQDGNYYIVAFYYREGKLNVVRVSDNVIEIIIKYSGGYSIEGHNILDI